MYWVVPESLVLELFRRNELNKSSARLSFSPFVGPKNPKIKSHVHDPSLNGNASVNHGDNFLSIVTIDKS